MSTKFQNSKKQTKQINSAHEQLNLLKKINLPILKSPLRKQRALLLYLHKFLHTVREQNK